MIDDDTNKVVEIPSYKRNDERLHSPSIEHKVADRDSTGANLENFRRFQLNGEGGDDQFCDNAIVTRKYSPWVCCPCKSLMEQFRRFANIYFLIQAILMLVGKETDLFSSAIEANTTIAALVFTVGLTGFLHLRDDIRRHLKDKETNNRDVVILTKNGTPETVRWADLRVGDLVLARTGQQIPADLMILCTSNEDNLCAAQTANIDGETNLKPRSAPKAMHRLATKAGDITTEAVGAVIRKLSGTVHCDKPNKIICAFAGFIELDSGEKIHYVLDNVLLRGSVLARCDWCIGLVVYTGAETKVMKNNNKSPSKMSFIDKTVNWLLVIAIIIQVVMVITMTILHVTFLRNKANSFWYLPMDDGNILPPEISYLLTSFVLFNNMIPISLYITLEVANVCQALFINSDEKMYDEASDTASNCKALNLCQEIGQVQYILSDKTGTLTQNLMKFKCCSINGRTYGVPEPEVSWTGSEVAENMRDEDKDHVDAFMMVLALCHTVIVNQGDESVPGCGGKYEAHLPHYEADNPDEEALVSGAAHAGYIFTGRNGDRVTVRKGAEGRDQTYVLLASNAFSSKRKCMSVVVQRPDGRKVLLVKGADNVILSKASNFNSEKCEALKQQLHHFACHGLRTLVVATRELDESVWKSWHARYEEANNSMTNRKEALASVAAEIEQHLTVVGGTANEDKLQDGVPAAVANLVAADIKVWVLTGDKTETAMNVSTHSRLLKPTTTVIKLVKIDSMTDDANRDRGIRMLKMYAKRLSQDSVTGVSGDLLDDDMVAVSKGDDVGLVIDGPLLLLLLGEDGCDQEGQRLVMSVADHCSVLVGCRFSPAQKAHMVLMIKQLVKPSPITLAIGDGANDVAMIQAAEVGVGIAGREGMQSVMASDFSFSQFRFLQRLLFLHGHWNYVRVSRMVLYCFYKNTMFMIVQLIYCFYNGGSGTLIGSSALNGAFNMGTTLPIVAFASFEQHHSAKKILNTPRMYDVGRNRQELGFGTLLIEMTRAVVHALFIWFICYSAMPCMQTLGLGGTDFIGTVLWSNSILVVTVRVTFLMRTWNWPVHVAWWSMLWAVMPLAFVYNIGGLEFIYDDGFDAYHTFFRLFVTPSWMFMCFGTLAACASFDYFSNFVRVRYLEYVTLKKHAPAGAVVPLQNLSAKEMEGTLANPPKPAPEPSKRSTGEDLTAVPSQRTESQSCSALRQQRLKSLKCHPMSHTLPCLFGIGGSLILTGILLAVWSQSLVELEIQYDGKRIGPDTDSFVYSPCAVPGSANMAEWEVKGSRAVRPRPLKDDYSRQCIVNITLAEKLKKSSKTTKYMVYYKLTRFFQNHQTYRKSFSHGQMMGMHMPTFMSRDPTYVVAAKCDIIQNPRKDRLERIQQSFPCGLISRSFFNDIIKLSSSSKEKGLEMNEKDITWPSNKFRMKKVDYELDNNVTDKYLFQRYPTIIKKSEGILNEHYSVWFRTEFLSNFIKKYGSLEIDQDLDKGETLGFNVLSAFEVASYKGTKSIVIQSYSALGGDLSAMGYVFIGLGVWSLAQAIVVLVDTLVSKRKRRKAT